MCLFKSSLLFITNQTTIHHPLWYSDLHPLKGCVRLSKVLIGTCETKTSPLHLFHRSWYSSSLLSIQYMIRNSLFTTAIFAFFFPMRYLLPSYQYVTTEPLLKITWMLAHCNIEIKYSMCIGFVRLFSRFRPCRNPLFNVKTEGF